MTHREFAEHWRSLHVPRVLAQRRGLTRYVTSIVDARLSSTGDDWDGFEEYHFAGAEQARAALAAGAGALAADRAGFVSRALRYEVGEYVQK